MAEYRRTSAEMAGSRRLVIGEYQFDGGAGQLWRGDEEIKLAPRASALLAALAERSMQVVTKQELIDRLWDGKAVGDDALSSCVQELRRALGDDPRKPRVVETRHRRGYRLLLPVAPDATASSAAEKSPLLPPSDKASVAVLPFENLGGEQEQEYFADGVAEDILTALSRFPGLFVIARKSSFIYKGKTVGIRQIGRELGVRYVLEGSVRKAGERVRITGQLIQADTEAHIWADRYDGELSDVFALQDRITEAVVGAIAPSIRQAETERAQRKPPASLDAYDLYLRAWALYCTMTREANDEARELLERAIALDPNYASAMLLLSLVWDCRISQGWAAAAELAVVAAESRKYLQLAQQIDNHDPDVLTFQARAMAYVDGRHEEAIALIERALTLNPNSAATCTVAGWICVYAGQSERAIAHLQRSMRLNPLDPADFHTWAPLAHAFIQLGRDDEALEAARQATQRGPNYIAAWRALSAILALTGRLEEAHAAMATLLRLAPTMSLTSMTSVPTRTAAARARYFEGLRLAGMPE